MPRVLMVNDIAFTAAGIRDALSSMGWESDQRNFPQRKDIRSGPFKRIRLALSQLAFALRMAVVSYRYDLVHVHYGYFGALSLLTSIPLVLHCHGSDLRVNLRAGGWQKFLTEIALRRAVKIFYSTPDLLCHIPTEYRHKSHFCPNSVNTDDLLFSPTECSNPNKIKGLNVFFISRLSASKGMENIVAVVSKLLQTDIVSHISVFGSGNLKIDISQLNHENLTVLEHCSRRKIADLIRDSDVVIGQMEVGSMGMSELECLLSGRPLIMKFEHDDSFTEPAPLVRVSGLEDVVSEIARVAEDPNFRSRLSQLGPKWVSDNHGIDAVCKALENAYAVTLPNDHKA